MTECYQFATERLIETLNRSGARSRDTSSSFSKDRICGAPASNESLVHLFKFDELEFTPVLDIVKQVTGSVMAYSCAMDPGSFNVHQDIIGPDDLRAKLTQIHSRFPGKIDTTSGLHVPVIDLPQLNSAASLVRAWAKITSKNLGVATGLQPGCCRLAQTYGVGPHYPKVSLMDQVAVRTLSTTPGWLSEISLLSSRCRGRVVWVCLPQAMEDQLQGAELPFDRPDLLSKAEYVVQNPGEVVVVRPSVISCRMYLGREAFSVSWLHNCISKRVLDDCMSSESRVRYSMRVLQMKDAREDSDLTYLQQNYMIVQKLEGPGAESCVLCGKLLSNYVCQDMCLCCAAHYHKHAQHIV